MFAYLIRRVCRRFVTGLWEPFLNSGTPPLTRTRKGQPLRSGTRAGWSSCTKALNRAGETPAHPLALVGLRLRVALAVVVGLLAEAPVTAIWAQPAKWLARSAEGSTLGIRDKSPTTSVRAHALPALTKG